MKLLTLLLTLLLTGCLHSVTPEDTSNCWRYGVSTTSNTGPMSPTPVNEILIVKLNYDELVLACGLKPIPLAWHNKDKLQLRACYDPMTDTIYDYTLNLGDNNMYVRHEKCHVMLGRKHNVCNSNGYGIGKDESACEWDL